MVVTVRRHSALAAISALAAYLASVWLHRFVYPKKN
jgi:hypothetical protein